MSKKATPLARRIFHWFLLKALCRSERAATVISKLKIVAVIWLKYFRYGVKTRFNQSRRYINLFFLQNQWFHFYIFTENLIDKQTSNIYDTSFLKLPVSRSTANYMLHSQNEIYDKLCLIDKDIFPHYNNLRHAGRMP